MGRAFAIGVGLNTLFVAVEVAAGFWAGSMALLADAGHNASDVLALLLAWGATILAKRAPTGRRTYGLRKGTILASLANAIFLLLAIGAIVSESIQRLAEPHVIATNTVMLTAGLGVLINTATALLFIARRQGRPERQGGPSSTWPATPRSPSRWSSAPASSPSRASSGSTRRSAWASPW